MDAIEIKIINSWTELKKTGIEIYKIQNTFEAKKIIKNGMYIDFGYNNFVLDISTNILHITK